MKKNELLLNLAEDLKSLAESIIQLSENEPIEKPKVKVGKKVEKEVKLEEVRAVLAEKSQAGFTSEVKEILEKFGAKKLSEVEPKKYSDLIKVARGIGNE